MDVNQVLCLLDDDSDDVVSSSECLNLLDTYENSEDQELPEEEACKVNKIKKTIMIYHSFIFRNLMTPIKASCL